MADTRLYELEECVSPQADDILLIEESATQTDKKVKVSSLMPTDAVESAVADWLDAHPEATTTVEDGSITPVKLATSTMDLFDEKANTSGEYDNLTVGSAKQLLSKGYTENKTPYIYRASAGGDRVYEKLIGGTIAWNQLVNNGDFASVGDWRAYDTNKESLSVANNVAMLTYSVAVTNDGGYAYGLVNYGIEVPPNHKVIMIADVNQSFSGNIRFEIGANLNNPIQIPAGSWTTVSALNIKSSQSNTVVIKPEMSTWDIGATLKIRNVRIFDLTQLFGTAIADYIYSLEQATAGAGVAYFRQMFPNDYYAYDSGSLQSVNVASKKVYDSNNTLVATYTFDSDLTLRGIPKLDANNNLYYDGDVYESDGTVTRKYGVVDLGSLTWYPSGAQTGRFDSNSLTSLKAIGETNILCALYTTTTSSQMPSQDMVIRGSTMNSNIVIVNTAFADYTNTQVQNALSGVHLVYELATPTTESADAYINPQIVDADGTEEFIDYAYSQSTRDVAVPVGHESKYMIDLREKIEDATMLPALPTANGTYTLKCTVASGVPTLSWVAD